MTATKETGYILDYEVYDGRYVQTYEFKTLPELRSFLENKTNEAKYHILWYNITKKIEAGTFTDETYHKWIHGKQTHNIPEPRIGDVRLRR